MQAIERAFAVLRALAERSATSSLADVTRASGLPKSTVLRLLTALEDQGAVQVIGGRYSIGPGLAALSHHGAPVSALREVARPYIVELADQLGENVSLTVDDGDATLYIDTAVAEGAVRVHDWTGERLPHHGSAGGLALLSAWTDEQLASFAASGLEAFTDATAVTVEALTVKVQMVHESGVVWTPHEFADDVTGVGAVIRDGAGDVVAALNAYGPSFRFPGARDPTEIEAALTSAAEAISTRLA